MARVELPRAEMQAFLDAIRAAPDDRTARLAFADWLQDHDDPRAAWVRIDELWEWMAPDAADPTPRILAALLDPAHEQRHADLPYLLDDIGPAATPPLRAWLRESPDARFPLVHQYLEFARPPKLKPVRSLMKQIRIGSWYDVYEAIIDLRFHGPKAAPAVDLLLDLPKHDKWDEFADQYHRQNPFLSLLYRTLGAIGPAALKAVPELASNAWHCEAAFDALDRLKPDPLLILNNINTDESDEVEYAIERIVDLDPTKTGVLKHAVTAETGRIRYAAARKLAEMGPAAADAIPALTEAVIANTQWDRDTARWFLIEALRSIGEAAHAAGVTMRAALEEPTTTGQARVEIGAALARLGHPDEGWPVLRDALEASDAKDLPEALTAVGEVAAVCPEAIPYLLASLRHPNHTACESAARQLQHLAWRDPQPEQTRLDWIPHLLAALPESSPRTMQQIAYTLGQIAERNTPVDAKCSSKVRSTVIDALIALVGQKKKYGTASYEDSDVRDAAVSALGHWGELPPAAAEPLRECAASRDHPADIERINAVLAKVRTE
jgi:uncharacterized protein (TIGR02996 family)